jgi:hypothetical protein
LDRSCEKWKKYYKKKRRRGKSCKQQKERKLHLIGSILLRNFPLKQVIEGKAEERSDGQTIKKT